MTLVHLKKANYQYRMAQLLTNNELIPKQIKKQKIIIKDNSNANS